MNLEVPIKDLQQHRLFVATPMYGGQCFGSYTKSLLDLSRVCQAHGITAQFSFIFNESLITRARNYLVDEFMRSDFTHLMFIDSDIDFNPNDVLSLLALNKPIIGGPYPKKSVPGETEVLTEDGKKTIRWIVDNAYTGKVLSMNNITHQLEYRNVVGHSVSPTNVEKSWVSIGRWGRKNLVCTADHECAVIDDVLFPSVRYCPAIETTGTHILKLPVDNGKNSVRPLYGKEQVNFLIGTLLGDGSISKQSYLKFGHSPDQSSYLRLKQQLFGGKISDLRRVGSYKGKSYYAEFMDCPRNAQIIHLRKILYPNNKKVVSPYFAELLTEGGLAFWYMDDGSYRDPGAVFCSEGFTLEEHEILQKVLHDKWNISSTIQHHGSAYRLYVPKSETDKFFSLIAPYVVDVMPHKLPKQYRNTIGFDYSTIKPLDIAAEYVYEVKPTKNRGKQYDIGVDQNHNFIANGHIVHNCLAWENIYDAIKYGMVPNDDRGQATNFAGDYVFNAVPGTTEIKLSEPAEVLEIGTGFMLIERSVFETFNKAYPQYWYNPDHNRSAAFDGTRKIYQYFQAEIEPERGRYLSEDYWFCQKAREAGVSVWLAPWMQLKHHGTYIYGGSLPAMAAVINERVRRNDPVPATTRMDASSQKPVTDIQAAPLTVKHLYTLSSGKRKEFFAALANRVQVEVGVVKQAYDANRDQWYAEMPDSNVEDLILASLPTENV